jgi:hypothetical protein
MKHYTYAYLREDKTPYYIGKGCGKRAWQHFKGEVRPPKDKSRILILKKNLSQDQAFQHEIYMIFVFGRKDIGTGILRNRTNGGEGNTGRKQSEETKKKIGDAHRGKTMSQKAREKISQARAGTPLSESHKESISNSLKGEKNPNFGKTGPSSPLYGKKRSPETKEKARQAALRRWEKHRQQQQTNNEQ